MINMNQEKKKFDSFKIKIFAVIALTIIITGTVTYGFFNPNKTQTGKNTLTSGCFNVTLEENTQSISLTNAYPVEDEKGLKNDPYTLTITNTCDTVAAYHLIMDSKTGSFDSSHIKVAVDERAPKVLTSFKVNSGYPASTGYGASHILKSGSLQKDESATMSIKLWIDSETTYENVSGKNWEGQVRVVSVVKEIEDANKTASEKTLDKLGLASNGVRTDFDDPATTDEGVFEMEDDYGMSYYYRGAVENNYVKFAGFYWRIIRVNGDGSLRIIYDGSQAYANGTNGAGRYINTSIAYNTNANDAKYVGWMYGPAGTDSSTSKGEAQTNLVDSNIKGVVDAWYKTNIEDAGYGNAVSDTLFCNDRSTPGKEVTGWSDDTGLGYGENTTAYGAYARMRVSSSDYTGATPTFKCPEKNDAFTVNDTSKGNGALTYPVGLITVDEIVAAGSGKYGQGTLNNKYYLYRAGRTSNWSLSPYLMNTYHATAFVMSPTGLLGNAGINSSYENAIAPVINLSAEYVRILKGMGTTTDPFQNA